MNNIKVNLKTKIESSVEVEVPKYFKYGMFYNRFDDNKRGVQVCTYDQSPQINTYGHEILLSGVDLSKIEEVTEQEFKEALSRTFAQIAGFKID